MFMLRVSCVKCLCYECHISSSYRVNWMWIEFWNFGCWPSLLLLWLLLQFHNGFVMHSAASHHAWDHQYDHKGDQCHQNVQQFFTIVGRSTHFQRLTNWFTNGNYIVALTAFHNIVYFESDHTDGDCLCDLFPDTHFGTKWFLMVTKFTMNHLTICSNLLLASKYAKIHNNRNICCIIWALFFDFFSYFTYFRRNLSPLAMYIELLLNADIW